MPKETMPDWKRKLLELTDSEDPSVLGDEYLDAIREELEAGRRQWKRGDKLLEAFGYTRRRQTVIDLINDRLKMKGMYTDPKLTTEMPLDRGITFYLKGTRRDRKPKQQKGRNRRRDPVEEIELAPGDADGDESVTVTVRSEPPIAKAGSHAEHRLIVGILACAERVPVSISPSATVEEALTKMAVHDFSQLVVVTGARNIRGVISYKAVAQAFLHGQPKKVADCVDQSVPIVAKDEPLLRVVERFNEHDAVLVIGFDKALAGIVTPADIAAEFGAMAKPFLLIGQIEEQLRWMVRTKLRDLESALVAVGAALDSRVKPSVSDFTMGELHRLLDHDENWSRIGIRYDRGVFCQELNAVRELRNAVMHFRELTDGGLERLERFANVVQTAYLQSTT